MTSWPSKFTVSCHWCVDHICPLASKSVHSFWKYSTYTFGNGTNEQTQTGQEPNTFLHLPVSHDRTKTKIIKLKHGNIQARNTVYSTMPPEPIKYPLPEKILIINTILEKLHTTTNTVYKHPWSFFNFAYNIHQDIYRVGQNTGLFLRSHNFATTNDRKVCDTSRMKCIICMSVQLNILCLMPSLHKSSIPPKLHWIWQWCASFV